MRTVGLDVGDRRIGVAVSDATGLIASAVGNIVRSDDDYEGDLKKTAAEIERLNGEQIVIGLPKNMNGTKMCIRDRRLSRRTAASGAGRCWR